ncbi:MAG: hypothetical protein ACW99U_02205 [Candidatus Thorarchaeota archaeon]|jgi:hypothetical protein
MSRIRFFMPVIFSAAGIGLASTFIYLVTRDVPSYDLFWFIAGTSLWTDIVFVLGVAIPILVIEFFIIAIPLALLFVFAHRVIKAPAYDLSIIDIGSKFGGFRIIRRAAAPALFSISSAGIIIGLIEGALFSTPPPLPPGLDFIFPISLTLMASLLLMPVALALYMPTWIVSDAGLTSKLKESQLEIRQTPDTEGVGRWYASALGGYSLITFPISMFYAHFYRPFVIDGHALELIPIIISTLWTVGLPLLIMAFIVPVAILHEGLRSRVIRLIQRYSRNLGAKDERSGAASK